MRVVLRFFIILIYPQFLLFIICPITQYHDDVIKWKHFPRYWPFLRGIHRSPVTGRLNTRLSKQWWGWWFETPLLPLWRHCNCYCELQIKCSSRSVLWGGDLRSNLFITPHGVIYLVGFGCLGTHFINSFIVKLKNLILPFTWHLFRGFRIAEWHSCW